MKLCVSLPLLMVIAIHYVDITSGYSALEDARIIAEYKYQLSQTPQPTNHAKVARRLVHQSNWSAVGSLSTDTKTNGYPMVNVISVADSSKDGPSTGIIYFLLTDLDFTGQDWKKSNKVTFFFNDDMLENCSKIGIDPMEPTCARAIISGQVEQLDTNSTEYKKAKNAFISRHPAATNWISVHAFYLCKLNIEHIYVLDWYGGPKDVSVDLYYKTDP